MPGFTLNQPEHRELTGGDLLAQSLKQLGVNTAFGIHGGHLDAFLMGCDHSAIRLIDTRHETVAVQAAEGYAKVSEKVGVCFVTANSGYDNSSTLVGPSHTDDLQLLEWFTRTGIRTCGPKSYLRDHKLAPTSRCRNELSSRLFGSSCHLKASHQVLISSYASRRDSETCCSCLQNCGVRHSRSVQLPSYLCSRLTEIHRSRINRFPHRDSLQSRPTS